VAGLGLQWSRFGVATGKWRASFLVFLVVALAPAAIWWLTMTYLIPDRISFSAFGHSQLWQDLHRKATSPTNLRFALIAGLFVGELASVGWRNSSLRKISVSPSGSARADITITLIQQVKIFWILKVIATCGLILLSGTWLRARVVDVTGLTYSLSRLPALVQFLIGYLAFSFLDYWAHRAAHTRLFWPLHRFHHAADDFCILNASRVHPADLLGFALVTVPLVILQPSPEVGAALTLLILYLRLFVHSRLSSELGWLGATLIQAPVHHRAHHAIDSATHATNFSLAPIWDHLFGTWRRSTDAAIAIGADCDYGHGAWFAGDLARDFREYLTGFSVLALRALGIVSDRFGASRPAPLMVDPGAPISGRSAEGPPASKAA
jgi:sterol desaturase/sphingolipid hydroxylase (fatty acid hydroxylase superfamily)